MTPRTPSKPTPAAMTPFKDTALALADVLGISEMIEPDAVAAIEAALVEAFNEGVEAAAQCADRVAVPRDRRDAMLGDIGAGMMIAATTIADAIRKLKATP